MSSAQTNEAVYAITENGGTLFVGGAFTHYRGTPVQNLAKFDSTTGLPDFTFTQPTGPTVVGGFGEVNSMLINAGSLFIGGSFTSYRGSTFAYKLAKLNTTTGALDPTFNSINGASGGPNNYVLTMATDGIDLFIGGTFTMYRGSANGRGVAKVNMNDGTMVTAFNNTGWTGGGLVNAILYDSSYLFIGGTFTNYRSNSMGSMLAKVSSTDGTLETGSFQTANWSGGQFIHSPKMVQIYLWAVSSQIIAAIQTATI